MSGLARKPILISGAGLASLLLAQSLRRAAIPFVIFERDHSVSFRAQGYRLRLSSQGLDAVESVLTPADFKTFWDTCGKTSAGGTGLIHLDAVTGEEVKDDAPAPSSGGNEAPQRVKEDLVSRNGQVVGISRGDLRRLFLSGCEEQVQWGKNVTGYEKTDSGVRAVFADGSKSVEGEMLVGGDGIYSKISKQLSNGKLKVFDTGARGIHGQAPTAAFKSLGEGVWRVTDERIPDGKVFMITNVRSGDMHNPDIEFGWTLGAQPGVIEPPNNDYALIGKPAADIAKRFTADWSPRLKPLFEQMVESEAAFWKITCSTPSGVPEWPNEPRITVIGDSVHSMTPAGGLGANTAFRSAALLGKLIAEADGQAREGVTAAYEKEMRVYASETVATSYGMAKMQFGINIDEATSKTV